MFNGQKLQPFYVDLAKSVVDCGADVSFYDNLYSDNRNINRYNEC